MASRWMNQKKAQQAAWNKKNNPFSPATTLRRPGHTIEASNALSLEVAKLTKDYKGVVTFEVAKPAPRAVGKNQRTHNTATHGNGHRPFRNKLHDTLKFYDLWDTSTDWEIVKR